jgi:hypothetical protein
MAYYLGRDVKVWLTTEDSTVGIINSSEKLDTDGTAVATAFANKLAAASVVDGMALADITGVDLGVSVTDEDITYLGLKSVLKAEIKKETSITLTRKKSNKIWDMAFVGPCRAANAESNSTAQGARWGIKTVSSALKISEGLSAPKDHTDGTNVTFGYRVHIQLKSAEEVISVPGCQITGHSISLNADGTTEETLELISNVDPLIAATANVTTRLATTDM